MCVYAFMCLLVSMMFLSSFWVLSFRMVVCYFFGWSSYSTCVPQFLGLWAFWLLCINSSPSYGFFLQSKYNIHSQSKGMRRSSVFIIDVANSQIKEKNVSYSAGVNESATSSHEVGSGSNRGAASRLDWTCLFYRPQIVWGMRSNLPLCQLEFTYELTCSFICKPVLSASGSPRKNSPSEMQKQSGRYNFGEQQQKKTFVSQVTVNKHNNKTW